MRIINLAVVSVLSGLLAIYSRFFNNALFDGILPQLFGTGGRAAVEHVLGGVAVSLAIVDVLALQTLIEIFQRLPIPMMKQRCKGTIVAESPAPFAILGTLVWALGYLLITTLLEIDQAFRSIGFISLPRGYMQWEQVACDLAGTLLGIGFAWLVLVPDVGLSATLNYLRRAFRFNRYAST